MGSQLRFRSDHHNVYTEEVNKIALSCSDNKRLQLIELQHIHMEQMFFKVCESEMLSKINV